MNLKKTLSFLVAGSMVVALVATAEGRSFGPGGKRRGMGGELGGLRTFLALKLSESQQAEMSDVITTYRKEMERMRTMVREAGKSLSAVLQAEPFDEEQARRAFRESTSIREEIFVLKAKMMAELKALLTPEQLELLKKQKAQRMERMRHRFDAESEGKGE